MSTMGYSLAVPFSTTEKRDQIMAFLEKEFRKWPAVIDDKRGLSYVRGPILSEETSYSSVKNGIGFDFNAAGLEREYPHVICRWLALRAGKRRTFNFSKKRLPFYYYDREATSVLVNTEWAHRPAEAGDRCTALGIYIPTHEHSKTWHAIERMMPGYKKQEKAMIDEMRRLNSAFPG
jgi:hypothetical protein